MDKVEGDSGSDKAVDSLPPSVPLANNVVIKLPAFWPDAAEVWFAQADAQFVYHMVAVLLQEVAVQLLDLICTPPSVEPYKVLKEQLITLYSLNDYQEFEALVSLPLSNDKKSSQLMNQMLALLRDDYKPDFILPGLFLRLLPAEVH